MRRRSAPPRPPHTRRACGRGVILAGKHRDIRAGIRRSGSTFGFRGRERAGADECARYLKNKQDYLDYPVFLASGWPVASGLIEGAASPQKTPSHSRHNKMGPRIVIPLLEPHPPR